MLRRRRFVEFWWRYHMLVALAATAGVALAAGAAWRCVASYWGEHSTVVGPALGAFAVLLDVLYRRSVWAFLLVQQLILPFRRTETKLEWTCRYATPEGGMPPPHDLISAPFRSSGDVSFSHADAQRAEATIRGRASLSATVYPPELPDGEERDLTVCVSRVTAGPVPAIEFLDEAAGWFEAMETRYGLTPVRSGVKIEFEVNPYWGFIFPGCAGRARGFRCSGPLSTPGGAATLTVTEYLVSIDAPGRQWAYVATQRFLEFAGLPIEGV